MQISGRRLAGLWLVVNNTNTRFFYAMGHNPWNSGLFNDIDFGMWVCFLKNIQIIDGTLALLKFGRGVLEGCES